jgi:cytochrome c-type biogenesis protein CcmH/NrfG
VAVEPEVIESRVDVTENLNLARAFYESEQYARATSVLEQVVQDAPRSSDAWLLLGLVRYDAHDTLGARLAAARVLAIDPRNARVQILLASMHFDAHETEAARAALTRYLELEPAGAFAEEARTLLRR